MAGKQALRLESQLVAAEQESIQLFRSFLICRTSKVTHVRPWRREAASTKRDAGERWVHRLVSLILFF
jgi:hypothetical protein